MTKQSPGQIEIASFLYSLAMLRFFVKQIISLLMLLVLISCVNAPIVATPTLTVSPQAIATSTLPPPTATAIPSPTPTLTFTAEPACDPLVAEFCIIDGHFLLQRPIRTPANDQIDPYYGFGSTANGTRDPHHGVEFENATGTPVYAAADGTVRFAASDDTPLYGPWSDFYGNLVVIEHADHLFTLYAHLSRIDVQAGQTVLAGEQIGAVGSTGGAIGSHLHFEVRQGNAEDYFAAQNPVLWLVPAQDEDGNKFGALMISVVDGNGHLLENANFTINDRTDSANVYYLSSYSPDMLYGGENLALGELSAGQYRIAVEMNGRILERLVAVESGRLTQVIFVIE